MLVVVSDLHLQHTAHDVVRFRDEQGQVRESGVRRNVDASALDLLFSEIANNVERSGSKLVELVFAGDIFELHRTPRWFFGGGTVRPFAADPAHNEPLRQLVHRILSDIEHENAPLFHALATFVRDRTFMVRGAPEKLPAGTELIVHYLPGNHDRLANAWASVRERVRRLLGMPISDAPFPHVVDRPRSEGYGVRVRHGHEYDATNFAGDRAEALAGDTSAYERPAIGDFVTVDIATRIAVAFRVRYAHAMREPGPDGERFRRIYCALTEFDDVRPPVLLVRYLTDALGAGEKGTFAILRPVLRDAFETARTDAFFISEAKRRGIDKYFEWPIGTTIDAAIKNFSGETLARIVEALDRFVWKPGRGPAVYACDEPGLAEGDIEVIVAGHTHEPDHVAIPGARLDAGAPAANANMSMLPRASTAGAPRTGSGTSGGGSGGPMAGAFYLDSGTWRTRIDAGRGSMFGRLRAYTMIFCYRDDELPTPRARRFETWTGHLAAAEYGPYEARPVERVESPKQVVRFTRCAIDKIDEGKTRDGAELRLFFGVDGVELKLFRDHVHDGDVIDLDETFAVDADPALDGEVFVWGYEEDLGDTILDRDDPLPWGVDFLPRADAGFAAGRRHLVLSSQTGGTLRLEYDVVAP